MFYRNREAIKGVLNINCILPTNYLRCFENIFNRWNKFMAIFFHIMYFNSVYGLPNKTVKIEEEPLLGVEVGLWCNLGRCFWSLQSHGLILNMQNLFTKRYVLQTILVSLSMVYWFRVETPRNLINVHRNYKYIKSVVVASLSAWSADLDHTSCMLTDK